MRYTHLSGLCTIEGRIVATVVLILTLIICRPRKDEAAFLTFLRKFDDWETSRSAHPPK